MAASEPQAKFWLEFYIRTSQSNKYFFGHQIYYLACLLHEILDIENFYPVFREMGFYTTR